MIEVTGLYRTVGDPSIVVVEGAPGEALDPQTYALGHNRGLLHVAEVPQIEPEYGRKIGYAAMHDIGRPGVAELFYDLSEYGLYEYKRQGIMQQATRAVIERAFESDTHLQEVVMMIAPHNVASRGLAQNLGASFQHKTRLQNDVFSLDRQSFAGAFRRNVA